MKFLCLKYYERNNISTCTIIFKMFNDVESVVRTIIERCTKEKTSGLQVALENVGGRVSYYTGLPRTIVEENIQEKSKHQMFLGTYERLKILEILRNLYKANLKPSPQDVYDNLREIMKKGEVIPNIVFLKRDLILLGFEHIKVKNVNQRVLIEDPEIAFQRHDYLNKIREYRVKNRNIYYVEERILNATTKNIKKPLPLPNIGPPSVELAEIAFLNVITKKSFVTGMFCSILTSEEFNKWLTELVLPNLKPHSVIVMDNNPIHCKKPYKSLTKYSSKNDMVKWLQTNGVPHSIDMSKSDLYKLIKKFPAQDDLYEIDYIIKAFGHDVLRLPLMIHDLTPNTYMWEEHLNELCWDTDFKNKLLNAAKTIPTTSFQKFDEMVVKKEQMFANVDEELEQLLEKYTIDP